MKIKMFENSKIIEMLLREKYEKEERDENLFFESWLVQRGFAEKDQDFSEYYADCIAHARTLNLRWVGTSIYLSPNQIYAHFRTHLVRPKFQLKISPEQAVLELIQNSDVTNKPA